METEKNWTKLKVIQQGGSRREHVYVVDANTGEIIKGIQKINFTASVKTLAVLTLETVDFDVELHPDTVTIIDNSSSQQKEIELLKQKIKDLENKLYTIDWKTVRICSDDYGEARV